MNIFLLFYMWKVFNTAAWHNILQLFSFHLRVVAKESGCFEYSKMQLWMILTTLKVVPNKSETSCLAFFFFNICPLNCQFALLFEEWRGPEEGRKSKNKNPTCPIITSHVKPNVFSHLDQILLFFVPCNYIWGYKWRTRAKPWFHICMVSKLKPIL